MNNDFRARIVKSYDKIAAPYAAHYADELDSKPFDRDMLDIFASAIPGDGLVCDLGCGPGQVARYLANRGVDVFGIDISPQMVSIARTFAATIRFDEGDMLALPLQDSTLAGIAAFYAIVNLPACVLRRVFEEMFRVLQPQGSLLLAFHIGEETIAPEELFGISISMQFNLFKPQFIAGELTDAGFRVERIFERDPYPGGIEYPSRRAYLFAKKGDPGRDIAMDDRECD